MRVEKRRHRTAITPIVLALLAITLLFLFQLFGTCTALAKDHGDNAAVSAPVAKRGIRVCSASKYTNPIKSLRIGKMELKSALDKKRWNDDVSLLEYRGKLRITAKKGWLVKNIEVGLTSNGEPKRVKNGYKVKKRSIFRLSFHAVNKRIGKDIEMTLWCP